MLGGEPTLQRKNERENVNVVIVVVVAFMYRKYLVQGHDPHVPMEYIALLGYCKVLQLYCRIIQQTRAPSVGGGLQTVV